MWSGLFASKIVPVPVWGMDCSSVENMDCSSVEKESKTG